MPKLTKASVGSGRRAVTTSPKPPTASTSHCVSPYKTRSVSPEEIIRKVRGRPPNKPAADTFGIDKNLSEQLDKILSNTKKVMTKLHSLGIDSDLTSSDEQQFHNVSKTDSPPLSQFSASASRKLHNMRTNNLRHKHSSNEKHRGGKRRHQKRGRRSPSRKYCKKTSNERSRRHGSYSGSSSSDDQETVYRTAKEEDSFNEFLRDASSHYKERKGKKLLYPCEFIRNDDNKKVQLGNSSWSEHLGAIFIMSRHRDVPVHWSKFLYKHMEDLCNMANDWSWPTCLRWSEKVFRMIEDGRLADGWTDAYAIKDVQRDICLLGTRAKSVSQEYKPYDYRSRPSYDKLSDGNLCKEWNGGKDCGFTHSHGVQPDRLCHLCSWCITKFQRTNAHRETDCINKRKYDKTATSQNPDTASKDF